MCQLLNIHGETLTQLHRPTASPLPLTTAQPHLRSHSRTTAIKQRSHSHSPVQSEAKTTMVDLHGHIYVLRKPTHSALIKPIQAAPHRKAVPHRRLKFGDVHAGVLPLQNVPLLPLSPDPAATTSTVPILI